VVVGQVPGDGVGSVVEAFARQFGAQRQDQLDSGIGQAAGAGVWSARAGLEGGLAFESVAGDQPGDPALGDPVAVGDLGLAAALDNDCGDDQTRFRHPTTVRPAPIPMSRDTLFVCLGITHCRGHVSPWITPVDTCHFFSG